MSEIKAQAAAGGLHIPKSWNVSATLGKSKGLAIRPPGGWEITKSGREHLCALGVSGVSRAEWEVAAGLRAELRNISNVDTRAFVEESVKCYEAQLYRSAIVMSWLAAMDVLKHHILVDHLSSFNAEAKRVNPKWKNAKNADDLGRMKEADFLDR